MKKIIQTIVFAAFIGLTSAVASNGKEVGKTHSFQSAMYLNKEGKLMINVQKEASVPVIIRIRDRENNVMHQHYLSDKATSCGVKLDISNLEDGNYKVEIISKSEKNVQNIELSTPEVVTSRTLSFEG